MAEVHVNNHTKAPLAVQAVVWTGDSAEGRLLQAHGWITGMDMGFSFDRGGPAVLRGLVGDLVAYPSDVIVRDDAGIQIVCQAEVFETLYEFQSEAEVLSDADEEPVAVLDSPIPTGINPNAVNLDVDQDKINKMAQDETLRELAAHADSGGEMEEAKLNDILKNAGWDPDSDTSETWTDMVQKVIDSGITVELSTPSEPEIEDEDDEEEDDDEEEEPVESTPDL